MQGIQETVMKRLLFYLATTLVATNLLAGYTYHFETVFSSTWSKSTITGLATVDGKKVRIDFEKGDDFLFPDAGILISTDGENFQVFDVAGKTYYDVKLGELLNPASGMTKAPDGTPIALSYANPKVDVKDNGDGGEVAGFSTRKYTIHTSYDMHVSLMGKSLSNHFEIAIEVWATDKLPASLMTFLQMQGLRRGIEDLDKLMDASPIRGFPLRQVMKHTGNYGGGRSRSWTMETTVTAVQESSIAASLFEPPAGYTKIARPSPMETPK